MRLIVTVKADKDWQYNLWNSIQLFQFLSNPENTCKLLANVNKFNYARAIYLPSSFWKGKDVVLIFGTFHGIRFYYEYFYN